MTKWAKNYGVDGTWIEAWAQDQHDSWRAGGSGWTVPACGSDDIPFVNERRAWFGGLHDWASFKKLMHDHLDKEMEAFRKACRAREAPEVEIPPDIHIAIEYAVLNRFAAYGTTLLAKQTGANHKASRIMVYIGQVNKILELPPIGLGTRKRKPGSR